MNEGSKQALTKVPAVTLGFWVIKILATTLGETGGDTVTMTLNWGYVAGVALFGIALVALVAGQILAKRFHRDPVLGDDRGLDDLRHDSGGFRRPIAGNRLHRRIASASRLPVGDAGTLALVRGNSSCEHRFYAESRGVLLGNHHVFADVGHRARRLARRHKRIWIRAGRAGIRRCARDCRSPLLLDRDVRASPCFGSLSS